MPPHPVVAVPGGVVGEPFRTALVAGAYRAPHSELPFFPTPRSAVALSPPAGTTHIEEPLAVVTAFLSEEFELLHPRREAENSTAGSGPPTIVPETMRLHPLGELAWNQFARLTSSN